MKIIAVVFVAIVILATLQITASPCGDHCDCNMKCLNCENCNCSKKQATDNCELICSGQAPKKTIQFVCVQ